MLLLTARGSFKKSRVSIGDVRERSRTPAYRLSSAKAMVLEKRPASGGGVSRRSKDTDTQR